MNDFGDALGASPMDPTDGPLSPGRRWPSEDPTASLRRGVAQLSKINGDRAVIEQAKGALMLRYAISSHEAFAVLVNWSRAADSDLHSIAHTLVNGIRQGGEVRPHEPSLVQWLEEQLRHDLPGDP